MSARERAEQLLVWYFQHAWEAAGLKWDGDNESEVRSIVDAILDAALAGAKIDASIEVEAHRQRHGWPDDRQADEDGRADQRDERPLDEP
jgi:hypothetical protein